MILTIKGADFSGSGLGTNTSVSITLTKGNGVSGSKVSSLTLEKNQLVSTATVIATGLSLQTGYENLVVTVTMNGSTVSGWFSNGTVTIPANTTITGNIKINASATAVSGGDTGGDNTGGGNSIYNINEKVLFANIPGVSETYITGTYYSGTVGSPVIETERSGYSSWKNIPLFAGETYEIGGETRLIQLYDSDGNIFEAYNYKNTLAGGTTIHDKPVSKDCFMSVAVTTDTENSCNYIKRLT